MEDIEKLEAAVRWYAETDIKCIASQGELDKINNKLISELWTDHLALDSFGIQNGDVPDELCNGLFNLYKDYLMVYKEKAKRKELIRARHLISKN